MIIRLNRDYFSRDVLEVAPTLPGKFLCVSGKEGITGKHMITDVEAYRGEEDEACHASRGMTHRNKIMYNKGGFVYMYLIYGIYWMLNIVTAEKSIPQAVLIRGITNYEGPGRLTKFLNLDGTYYGEDVCESERIWIEDHGLNIDVGRGKRISIDYAGSYWRDIEWRYYVI